MNFDGQYAHYKKLFEEFLANYIAKFERDLAPYYAEQLRQFSFLEKKLSFDPKFSFNYTAKIKTFLESLKYSILGEGKRFRPVIVLATAEMCSVDPQKVLPYALAVEMIHTYSLIHDDLPCMDNDDVRRGQPTNHKVFGESTALLAGDALLTEAFDLITKADALSENKLQCISLLTECVGLKGMIGGQYFDLETQKAKVSLEELTQTQLNKTGALIYAGMMGSAILCQAKADQKGEIEKYARLLGLSFQIADDILDQDKNEVGSFVNLIGLKESKELLNELNEIMFRSLKSFESPEFFTDLATYNKNRQR